MHFSIMVSFDNLLFFVLCSLIVCISFYVWGDD